MLVQDGIPPAPAAPAGRGRCRACRGQSRLFLNDRQQILGRFHEHPGSGLRCPGTWPALSAPPHFHARHPEPATEAQRCPPTEGWPSGCRALGGWSRVWRQLNPTARDTPRRTRRRWREPLRSGPPRRPSVREQRSQVLCLDPRAGTSDVFGFDFNLLLAG